MKFQVTLCEEDGTGEHYLADPHEWSSVAEAWCYWESQAERFQFVLVGVDLMFLSDAEFLEAMDRADEYMKEHYELFPFMPGEIITSEDL